MIRQVLALGRSAGGPVRQVRPGSWITRPEAGERRVSVPAAAWPRTSAIPRVLPIAIGMAGSTLPAYGQFKTKDVYFITPDRSATSLIRRIVRSNPPDVRGVQLRQEES